MKKIIASATTLEKLENLLNEYYYANTYKIHTDLTITNSKGVFDSVFIKQIKNRYAIYSK
jgi:hypothetical protein